jgi:hypothetical protein
VISEAVRLDHETELGPVEVDFVSVDYLFAAWHRHPGGGRDRPEEDLEIRIGEPEHLSIKHLSQGSYTGLSGEVGQIRSQFLRIDHVALVGIVDGSLERQRTELGSQVDESASRRRQRDSVPQDDLVDREVRPAPDVDSGPPQFTPPADAHVDPSDVLPRDAPEGRGAPMAERSTITAGEDRRHPALLWAHPGPADRVYPSRNGSQPAPADPVLDLLGSEPDGQQLTPRNQPMLSLCQRPGRGARGIRVCTPHRG